MGPQDEYLRNARECRALAEQATSPEIKADWLRLAAKWESLASATEDGIFHISIKPNDDRHAP